LPLHDWPPRHGLVHAALPSSVSFSRARAGSASSVRSVSIGTAADLRGVWSMLSWSPTKPPISGLFKSSPLPPHDFDQSCFAIVPVDLILLNLSPFVHLKADIVVLQPGTNADEKATANNPAPFLWNGVTKFSSVELPPKSSRLFRLTAAFNAPGVYDLGDFKTLQLTLHDTRKSSSSTHGEVLHPDMSHLIEIAQKTVDA